MEHEGQEQVSCAVLWSIFPQELRSGLSIGCMCQKKLSQSLNSRM